MVIKVLNDIPNVLGSDSLSDSKSENELCLFDNIYFSDHYADTLSAPIYLGSDTLATKVSKNHEYLTDYNMGNPAPTALIPNPVGGGLFIIRKTNTNGNCATTLLVFSITIILLLVCIIAKDVYFIVLPQVIAALNPHA